MKNLFVLFVLGVVACGVSYEPDMKNNAQPSVSLVTTSSATVNTATTVATSVAGAGVTRHLPGTILTTATGKYFYLVRSNGVISAFASQSIVTSSGYKTTQAIIITTDELSCYGRGDQIVTALVPPSGNQLRDGVLVKEKGKSSVYIVSDSVAWAIQNQTAFDLAGYNFANVVEIAAGALAGSVGAVGDCVAGVACLDTSYSYTCAKEESVETVTGTNVETTTTNTGTQVQSGTVTSVDTQTVINLTQSSGANVVRHLPGTVITTGSGKYYLVNNNETVSPFASPALVISSGYLSNMVIRVSSAELSCYGLDDQINASLQAPPNNRLRDGVLVKEIGRSDTYVVSEGVAWAIKNETAFNSSGYTFDAVKQVSAGGLAGLVYGVGDCVSGLFCLDVPFTLTCTKGSQTETVTEVVVDKPTKTETSVNTSVVTVATVNTATSTSAQTQTQSQTQTVAQVTVVPTVTVSNTNTTTKTATTVPVSTAIATNSATVTNTNTNTNTNTATVTTNQTSSAINLSWVYVGEGSKLCLNANYFAGSNKAVLLIWSGPAADSAKGPVVMQAGDRFCWDFANREKGLYYFWADVPDASCNADTCARDNIPGNGAMYMTAPKATPEARKWLYCEPTGCDGNAYWDGMSFSPMGG